MFFFFLHDWAGDVALVASLHCISLSCTHTGQRMLIPYYACTNSLINIPSEDESGKLLLIQPLWFPPWTFPLHRLTPGTWVSAEDQHFGDYNEETFQLQRNWQSSLKPSLKRGVDVSTANKAESYCMLMVAHCDALPLTYITGSSCYSNR